MLLFPIKTILTITGPERWRFSQDFKIFFHSPWDTTCVIDWFKLIAQLINLYTCFNHLICLWSLFTCNLLSDLSKFYSILLQTLINFLYCYIFITLCLTQTCGWFFQRLKQEEKNNNNIKFQVIKNHLSQIRSVQKLKQKLKSLRNL